MVQIAIVFVSLAPLTVGMLKALIDGIDGRQ